ncbi:MAG: hypothetical protein ABIG44_10600 [Planctomycetota bacterium]
MPTDECGSLEGLHRQCRDELSNEFACANLAKLRTQWREVPYRELIRQTIADLKADIEPSMRWYLFALNGAEAHACEQIIDEANTAAQKRAFWDRPCSLVLQTIVDRFEELMQCQGREVEDRFRYAVFQCVTLNFAKVARDDRKSRQFAGITRPWALGGIMLAFAAVPAVPIALYGLGAGTSLSIASLCFGLFALSVFLHRHWLLFYAPQKYAALKSRDILKALPNTFDEFMRRWTEPPGDLSRQLQKLGALEDPRVFYGRIADKHLMPIPRVRMLGMCAFCLGVVLLLVWLIRRLF